MRAVYFTNQYYGGFGNKMNMAPRILEGAVGPAAAAEKMLVGQVTFVATVVCGDNYIMEHRDDAVFEVVDLILSFAPDFVIAGPAISSANAGTACGEICLTLKERAGIPAVTAMDEHNLALELYRMNTYIIRSEGAWDVESATMRMTRVAIRLARGETVELEAEGCFSHGLKRNVTVEEKAPERVVNMLLAKLRGDAFETEVKLPDFGTVKRAAPIKELGKATIAVVTDGGLVPVGNPDGIEASAATKYSVFSIEGKDFLEEGDFEVAHMGYDVSYVTNDPNRLVPLDALRELENAGKIGRVFENVYSTSGVITPLVASRRMGEHIAAELGEGGVDAALLVSTCGSSTRCGATIVKELERAGIPTVHICSLSRVAQMIGSNRIYEANSITWPLGMEGLPRESEKALRKAMVEGALALLAQ